MPTFLTPYLLWIKLGAAALVIATIFGAGMWLEATIKNNTIKQMELDAANAVAQADADGRKKQAAADKITHDRDVKNATEHQKIVTVTQHIIQKVPVYVTQQTDNKFPLPCGFVRLHDAAASGAEPETISLPANHTDADECQVTASTAASIIAGNYSLALGWRNDVKTWEDWYADQVKAWNTK